MSSQPQKSRSTRNPFTDDLIRHHIFQYCTVSELFSCQQLSHELYGTIQSCAADWRCVLQHEFFPTTPLKGLDPEIMHDDLESFLEEHSETLSLTEEGYKEMIANSSTAPTELSYWTNASMQVLRNMAKVIHFVRELNHLRWRVMNATGTELATIKKQYKYLHWGNAFDMICVNRTKPLVRIQYTWQIWEKMPVFDESFDDESTSRWRVHLENLPMLTYLSQDMNIGQRCAFIFLSKEPVVLHAWYTLKNNHVDTVIRAYDLRDMTRMENVLDKPSPLALSVRIADEFFSVLALVTDSGDEEDADD